MVVATALPTQTWACGGDRRTAGGQPVPAGAVRLVAGQESAMLGLRARGCPCRTVANLGRDTGGSDLHRCLRTCVSEGSESPQYSDVVLEAVALPFWWLLRA